MSHPWTECIPLAREMAMGLENVTPESVDRLK
jgi:hypothetical protein